MLELLQCEELFPSEPSLSQRSDEQARQVMIAQIAASKLLLVITLNNGNGCAARKEFVAQVKLMLVSEEACVFATNVMLPLVATQIRGATDEARRIQDKHLGDRALLRVTPIPVEDPSMLELVLEAAEIANDLDLTDHDALFELMNQDEQAFTTYSVAIHLLNRSRYEAKYLSALGEDVLSHTAVEVDENHAETLAVGLRTIIENKNNFSRDVSPLLMQRAKMVLRNLSECFYRWQLNDLNYSSLSGSSFGGVQRARSCH